MAQPAIQPGVSGAATRQGVVYGVLLGLLSLPTIALVALNRLGGGGSGQVILFGFTGIAIILTFVAGLISARRTGALSSGAVAGLIAGALAGFIAVCLGTVIIILLTPYIDLRTAHAVRLTGRRAPGPIADILRLLLGGVILTALGLIMGTLGGLIGRIGRGRSNNSGGVATGYASGGPAPTSYAAAPPTNQGYQTYRTPVPERESFAMDDDVPDESYSSQSMSGAYSGDDPTTMMPNPQYPTPIPDDSTPTPSMQQPTGY